MKYLSKAAIVLPLLALALALFLLFFSEKNSPPEPQDSVTPAPQAVSLDTKAEPSEEYLLIAEDGYLNLYETADSPSVKYSERLDTLLLPHSDRLLLANGLYFKSLDEAYQAMESFVN